VVRLRLQLAQQWIAIVESGACYRLSVHAVWGQGGLSLLQRTRSYQGMGIGMA
jgi:hypothetical protein